MKRFILFFCAFITSLFAQNNHNWQTYTYMNDVKDIIYYDDHIWAATTGGAYSFKIADSTFQKFTNVDGLISMDLTTLSNDQHNNIIFAASDGNISIYNILFDSWSSDQSLLGQYITDIFINNDTLWVAANNGTGVFLYDNGKYEFRDFYNNFPINPDLSSKIVCFNNQIFYGTKNGLLYTSSNFIKLNLKSLENWDVHTTANILPNNDVRTLKIIKDTLYIGTANGATRLAKDGWYDNALNWNDGVVNNIEIANDIIHFFRNNDYFIFSGNSWQQGEGYDFEIHSLAKDYSQNLWIGFRDNGLMNWNWNNCFKIDGPASNRVGIVKKDSQGNLWMTSGKFFLYYYEGFYKYNRQFWTNYKFSENWWTTKNSTVYIFEDSDNNIWIGNWNGGITTISDAGLSYIHIWKDPGKLTMSTNLETQIIELPGVSDEISECFARTDQPFANTEYLNVITYIIEDNSGNLYIANMASEDGDFITVIPRDETGLKIDNCDNWIRFGLNIGISLAESQISSMLFDDTGALGRLWVGTYKKDLLVIDFNETLEDTLDDQIYRIDTDDNLYSHTILCLNKDKDGVIWIGTDAGLNSYDGQNFYKHVGETGPIENKINNIFVDDYNNKWFATDGGMSILEGDKSPWEDNAWTHYTPDNSKLAGEIVNSIYVDSKLGEAYIGTNSGLSIFRGSYAQIRTDYDLMIGGPNPFFVGNSNNNFTLKSLMVNSTVKILTINGRLVKTLSEENGSVVGGRAKWNGRDDENNIVSSGIYIYMVYNEQGVIGKGKISVIRK